MLTIFAILGVANFRRLRWAKGILQRYILSMHLLGQKEGDWQSRQSTLYFYLFSHSDFRKTDFCYRKSSMPFHFIEGSLLFHLSYRKVSLDKTLMNLISFLGFLGKDLNCKSGFFCLSDLFPFKPVFNIISDRLWRDKKNSWKEYTDMILI